MSGEIVVTKDKLWMYASWVYDHVLRTSREHVPEDTPSLKQKIDERFGETFRYIDLAEWTSEEVRGFLKALQAAYKETAALGPEKFGDPSFFPGYMDALLKLIKLLEEEVDTS